MLLVLIAVVGIVFRSVKNTVFNPSYQTAVNKSEEYKGGLENNLHPLSIEYLRQENFPGSDITIEQPYLQYGSYNSYITSYKSEGLKIYALLTIPSGENPPAGGWPVIIFNHGYIPPEQYQTTERYVAYLDAFASAGYIVFKPDYRGHGNSEGIPSGAYYSPGYTIDVLNALSSIKLYKDVNPDRIGMWGHSMGGSITLRSMVVSPDIKAGVIWGGVVGSYDDLINHWRRRNSWNPSPRENISPRPGRQSFINQYGTPQENPTFWNSIDPSYFLSEISGPIQLHHGLNDETVPWEFSENLKKLLEAKNKQVELYLYPEADHNISGPFNQAINRSVEFFDRYLKEKPSSI